MRNRGWCSILLLAALGGVVGSNDLRGDDVGGVGDNEDGGRAAEALPVK